MTVLSHIASQTKSNIEFLVSQGQLDDIDCRPLLVKLEAILQSLGGAAPALSPVQISKTDRLSPEPPPFSSIGTDYKVLFRARAVYGYNEHDQNPRDLSFSPGDIIEVLKEANSEWWEGRCNGRVGVFPSNHVENAASLGFPGASIDAPPALTGEKFSSHIPTPNYQPVYITPVPVPVYTPTTAPNQVTQIMNPSQPTVVVNEEQKPTKHRKHLSHGGLGSTLVHSAVGGAGFGVGSAIGNGLVNSIF